MNNIFKTLIVLVILASLGIAYYNYRTNTYVTAEFKKLRPFHDRAPIYYNGFKIGKVVKVKPNKTYTSTIVTMKLKPQDLKLPINSSVLLKKERNRHNKKFDYIEIIYPKNPSNFLLKDGDKISGKTTVELDTYMSNQEPESLDEIKADFASSVKNLNVTIETIGELFSTLNSMVEEVKPNLVDSSKGLKYTSENFVNITKNVDGLTDNFNKTLDENRLNSTTRNIQATSKNIKILSGELNKSMPNIQCTINEANKVLCNIEEMTSGLNCTMKKPFGGLRLFFGRPICKK